MNSLQLRKQMLIAESDLNRAQLIQEWQAMAGGMRSVVERTKSFRTLAVAAASLISGLVFLRRKKSSPPAKKFSWWQALLKGATFAGSLWAGAAPPKKS